MEGHSVEKDEEKEEKRKNETTTGPMKEPHATREVYGFTPKQESDLKTAMKLITVDVLKHLYQGTVTINVKGMYTNKFFAFYEVCMYLNEPNKCVDFEKWRQLVLAEERADTMGITMNVDLRYCGLDNGIRFILGVYYDLQRDEDADKGHALIEQESSAAEETKGGDEK